MSTTWSEADDFSAIDPRQSWASQETSVQAHTPDHALRLAEALHRLRVYGLPAAELGDVEADVEELLAALESDLRARATPRGAVASVYLFRPAGPGTWEVAAPGLRVRAIRARGRGFDILHAAASHAGRVVRVDGMMGTAARMAANRALDVLERECRPLAIVLRAGLRIGRGGDVRYDGMPIAT